MKTSLSFLLFFLSLSVLSQNYYIEKAKASGNDSNRFAAVNTLVNDAVANHPGAKVVGSKKAAQFILVPQLLSMGESYIFSMQKQDQAGNIVYATKLKSESLPELDSVISRVTRGALSEKQATRNVRVGEVTDADTTRNTKKVEADKSYYFGFGPGWSRNVNGNDGIDLALGAAFGIEHNFNLLADLTYINTGDSSSYQTYLTLGARYFFTDAQHSPYVTANIGYGWARYGEDTEGGNAISNFLKAKRANGWALGGSIGMEFFRTSSVRIGAELKTRFLLEKFDLASSGLEDKAASSNSINIVLSY